MKYIRAIERFKDARDPVDGNPLTRGFTYRKPRPAAFYKELGQMKETIEMDLNDLWKEISRQNKGHAIIKKQPEPPKAIQRQGILIQKPMEPIEVVSPEDSNEGELPP